MNMQDYVELEEIIDRNSLNEVITKLAEIAFEKAEHIKTEHGEDDADAEDWDDAGDDLENCAMEVSPL